MNWVKEGDLNTSYFHAVIKGRRARNKISSILLHDGTHSFEPEPITTGVLGYFNSILNGNFVGFHVDGSLFEEGHKVEEAECILLTRQVTMDEITSIIRKMPNNKAVGPDSFSIEFFKSAWSVCGNDILESVWQFFRDGRMPRVVEVLARRLNNLSLDKKFGFHLKCKKITLTHLMFADGVLIMAKANMNSILAIKKALDDFYLWSWLEVRYAKSNIYCGGVSRFVAVLLAEGSGFALGQLPFKYLGIPLNSHCLRKHSFDHIIDEMTGKISSWTARRLPYAGRLVLIKHVLSSICAYWMRILILPQVLGYLFKKGISLGLEAIIRSGGEQISREFLGRNYHLEMSKGLEEQGRKGCVAVFCSDMLCFLFCAEEDEREVPINNNFEIATKSP
ncbi:hypothetical protein QQ045_017244 [Rhodiola kirilowii]